MDENDRIEESLFPWGAATYWSMFLTLELGAVALSSILVLPLCVPHPGDILFGYGVAATVLAPLSLIFSGTQLRYLQKQSGRILFDGQEFSIFSSKFPGSRGSFVAKPSECRWFLGRRSLATVPMKKEEQFTPLEWERFFLIEFPNRCRISDLALVPVEDDKSVPVIVAVGHGLKSRERWQEIFYRYGVEHDEDRENPARPFQ